MRIKDNKKKESKQTHLMKYVPQENVHSTAVCFGAQFETKRPINICPSVKSYENMRIYGCIQNWLESVESSNGVIQCVHLDPLHYSEMEEMLTCVSRKKLQLAE
jgi:hypothetical protein